MNEDDKKYKTCLFSEEWKLIIRQVNKKRRGEFYDAVFDYLFDREPQVNPVDLKTFEILKCQLDRVKKASNRRVNKQQALKPPTTPTRPPRPSTHHVWSDTLQEWVYAF